MKIKITNFKIRIISILILSILISCAELKVNIQRVKTEQAISQDAKFYFYFDGLHSIPDSAKYIGKCEVEYKKGYDSEASFRIILERITQQFKESGANCLVIEAPPYDNNKTVFQGWLYKIKDFEKILITEDSLKRKWEITKPDLIEGIYTCFVNYYFEGNGSNKVRFGIYKVDENQYKMIYYKGFNTLSNYSSEYFFNNWESGEVMSYIKASDKANVFTSNTYDFFKNMHYKTMMKIDNGNLKLFYDNKTQVLEKLFPETSKKDNYIGSFTGFAIDNSRIITSFSGVLDKKTKIFIKGINGDFSKRHEVEIEKSDNKFNLSVMKIKDSTIIQDFSFFPVNTKTMNLSDEVFVLGYPVSFIMGEDIKLTNGNISSLNGLGSNNKNLQFSAPVQSGNTGSPLFDNDGNLIGIVNGGIKNADNIGYALKFSQVENFLKANSYNINYAQQGVFKNLSLKEKVDKIKNNVFLIEFVDEESSIKDKNILE